MPPYLVGTYSSLRLYLRFQRVNGGKRTPTDSHNSAQMQQMQQMQHAPGVPAKFQTDAKDGLMGLAWIGIGSQQANHGFVRNQGPSFSRNAWSRNRTPRGPSLGAWSR